MLLLGSREIVNRQRKIWRILVIMLAISGLSYSLATRTFRLTIPHGVTVRSGEAQAMRQHLDRDAVRWFPPAPVIAVLQAPSFYPHVAPAGPPLPVILLSDSLYNRPPPVRG